MYVDSLRMHGPKYNYNIMYDDIGKLYMLEKPDNIHVAFVVSLVRYGYLHTHIMITHQRTDLSAKDNSGTITSYSSQRRSPKRSQ
jgi:hypothetical protein